MKNIFKSITNYFKKNTNSINVNNNYITVYRDYNNDIAKFPFSDFYKYEAQIPIYETDKMISLGVSIPDNIKNHCCVKYKFIYDDGNAINKETTFNDKIVDANPYVVFDVVSEEKCYIVKIEIDIIDYANANNGWYIETFPIYQFDIDQHINSIEDLHIYIDKDYKQEILMNTHIENSLYTIDESNELEDNTEIYVKVLPDDGEYMLKTFKNNEIKIEFFNSTDIHFTYQRSIDKIILYKLGAENRDAIVIAKL